MPPAVAVFGGGVFLTDSASDQDGRSQPTLHTALAHLKASGRGKVHLEVKLGHCVAPSSAAKISAGSIGGAGATAPQYSELHEDHAVYSSNTGDGRDSAKPVTTALYSRLENDHAVYGGGSLPGHEASGFRAYAEANDLMDYSAADALQAPTHEEPASGRPAEYAAARQARLDSHDYEEMPGLRGSATPGRIAGGKPAAGAAAGVL